MKVAHLCGSADSRIGGSLPVARGLVAKQMEQGVDARLVYLYNSPAEFSVADSPRVPSVSVGIDRAQRYTRGAHALRGVLHDIAPDVIHHHDGLVWPRFVTPGIGVPIVTHAHSEAPAGWGARMVQRIAMRGTRRLLAVSDWTARSWVQAGYPAQRISVLPNGVDCERFRRRSAEARRAKLAELGLDAETRVLLWAGRIERARKGLDRLLRVGKALPSGWVCVIAGDGTDRQWLASQIDALADKARFRMLGNVPDPEEWFGISDAFLFTSTVEPFGLVVLEAAASSLPIVGFPCEGGAMKLLEEMHAEMVDDHDDARIQSVIEHICDSPNTEAVRQFVHANYSWDSVAGKTIAIYRQLVA